MTKATKTKADPAADLRAALGLLRCEEAAAARLQDRPMECGDVVDQEVEAVAR